MMAIMEFYKKGQGSIARTLALVAAGAMILWGGSSLWIFLQGDENLVKIFRFEVPPPVGLEINLAMIIAAVVVIAGWVGLVWFMNRPRAVDLLIETESEMRKVSWPSKAEAWNSSLIVVVTVLVMMGLLFFYDFGLNLILTLLFT